jgi:NADPH:quinone reductase-like Zn-dependent oxidoreductase
MRAAVIRGFGGPERIEIADLPEPVPGPGEVSLRVRAASLNHLDVWVRTGRGAVAFPHVLGTDAAGVVQAVGEGVRGIAPGDEAVVYPAIGCERCDRCLAGEVSLCADFKIVGAAAPGVYADVMKAPAGCFFPKPPGLSFEAAACLAVNFLTAWRMVVTRGRVRPGETVLVTGIGGGVAVAALQIAVAAGARVLVTSSSDAKIEHARGLGASAGINYRTSADLAAAIRDRTDGRGVDVVIDSAGEAAYAPNLAVLRKGGRLVICGVTTGGSPPADLRQIYMRQLEVVGSTLGSRAELAQVLALAAAGRLSPVIDGAYPLERVREATERMERGEQFGKLVLRIAT